MFMMNWTDKIQVTNEDNMELMKRYPNNYFDLAIVDPPYGAGDVKKCTRKNYKTYLNIIPSENYWDELFRVTKNQIVCGGNYFTNYLKPSRGWVCWDKMQPIKRFADGEMIWTSFDVNTKFFRYMMTNVIEGSNNISNGSKKPNIHPTQKPVALYEWLLMNYAKEGDKILDTHLGSGSIAIACHNLGFELTACELDKDYYEASHKRFKQVTSQTQLF